MSTAQSQPDPEPLQLTLLGGFELRCAHGRPIPLHNKTMLLIALLALARGRTMSRARLISLLWSDRAEPQARASLRQALWGLRGKFRNAAPEALRVDGEMVHLDASAVAVDVERFERLVGQTTTTALEAAARLYGGDLLDGVRMRDRAGEEHLIAEQARLRDLALSGLDRLLNTYTADTPRDRIVDTAHRLLGLDPCNEFAHRKLMWLWAHQDRCDLALKQFETCQGVLRRELGIAPQPETERLADDIRCGRLVPQSDPPPAPRHPPSPRRPAMHSPAAISIAVLALALIGSIVAISLPGAGITDDLTAPERQRPAVSVVAMAAPDGEARSARTAARLGEAFVTALSPVARVHLVDAPAAAFGGAEAVRYVVRSSAEGTNPGTRLRVDLIDGHSAQPIWSERYDIGDSDPGDSRSAPVSDAYTALLTHVTAAQETANAQAAAAFVRGWHSYGRHELEADRMALAAFSEAIELDPGYGRAHAALAALYWRCWLNHCGAGRHLGLSTWPEARDRAEQHLRHALEAPTPLAHQVAARMAMALGRHAQAVSEAEQALSLAPGDADSFATLAEIRTVAGAPFEALIELERVHGTKLAHSRAYPRALGRTLFAAGRFAEAAEALERAIALKPGDKEALKLLTATYGHLGRAQDATATAAALTEVLRRNYRNPGVSYRLHMAEFESVTQLPGDRSLLLNGLRLAGIPN